MIALVLALALDEQVNARPARGERFMVVAEHPLAARAGLEVLRRGGNAADAAIATAFALAVVYPQAGNLGGGGFLLWRGADGEATTIDFRERAPAAAKPDMYLDAKGAPIPGASDLGPLAAGVPGSVAGLALARDRLGTKPLAELLAPAIALAEEGFPADPHLCDDLAEHAARLARFPAAAAIFLPGGKPPKAGAVFRQPDLGRTLRAIAASGADAFYRGPLAERLVDEVAKGGGIFSKEDLASYRAVERAPLRGTYRGHELVTMGPPSAGGVVLLEALNLLEGFDLKGAGAGSSLSVHLVAESLKRAFADRFEFLGDPDHASLPLERLLSKEHARRARAGIDPEKASDPRPGAPASREGNHTTHLAVVDGAGNGVSLTTTINDYFGNHFVAAGTGFLLNNEMDDFVTRPDAFGRLAESPNAIGPGKRMLSSMTPTVVAKEGKALLVVGSPGGLRIPGSVLQVIVNQLDHGMGVSEAIRFPRVHHAWRPDRLETERLGLSADVRDALVRRGHRVEERGSFCSVQAIAIRADGTRIGFSDPRRGGLAAGE